MVDGRFKGFLFAGNANAPPTRCQGGAIVVSLLARGTVPGSEKTKIVDHEGSVSDVVDHGFDSCRGDAVRALRDAGFARSTQLCPRVNETPRR
jgi:hypothetical protein